jgi:hypothetical protein
MKRLLLTLKNDLKLVRTSIPVHLIAMLQPTVMYLLMSVILVYPTFDMYVTRPTTEAGISLVAAMREVGSPIGLPYINPILIDVVEPESVRQVVTVKEREGKTLAVQDYGLIDSNMVKNFRNRLTAAALRVWNKSLGDQAIQIEEHPWLPEDKPYTLFFGMAMLPLTAAVAASMVGGILIAQDFEYGTIQEYQLAPAPALLVISARLIRLVFLSLISTTILLVTLKCIAGVWPEPVWKVGLIIIPAGVIAGCLGMIAGLLFKKSIPAFIVGLVTSFVGWLLGSAFGLAAGFNRIYEFVSRLTPNTHAVELLYPLYFGGNVGNPWFSWAFLLLVSGIMIGLTLLAYRWSVQRQI